MGVSAALATPRNRWFARAAAPFACIYVRVSFLLQARGALALPVTASDAAALSYGAAVALAIAVGVATPALVVCTDLLELCHICHRTCRAVIVFIAAIALHTR